GGADPAAVAAISLSKTPIMRMKTKSEPKRIAVSLKSADEAAEAFGGGGEGELGGEQEPIEAPLGPMTPVEMLMHDSIKLGGGGLLITPQFEQQRKSSILNPTVLPAGLAQVLSAFQAQQNTAAAQPQLLIPLSSIPSYSAAMDTNPLLGTTYKKFPYPSMAEISSLAAQTQFTEEQIKVWFSAQRLKHGVSWTPEEVEEARRKQFNGTVHTVPQTITVIPAHQLSAAANGLQSILQTCQIVGQPGLVFTQVGGNLPVTSPITLTVAGLPSQSQSSSRVSCQPTLTNSELKRATTIQPPSLSPQNSALSVDTFSMRPKKSKEQLAELKASYLKNHFVTDAEIARLMKLTNLTKGEIKKWFSDTRYNQRNSKNSHVIVSAANTTIVIDSSDETPTSPHPPRTPPVKEKETRPKTWNPFPDFTLQKFKEKTPEQLVVLEESFEKNTTPSDEELSRLRTETKLTRREIDAWFTERRKMPSVSTSSPDSSEGGKIETDGAKAGEGGGTGATASSSPPDKSKKTPEQLHILKSAFVRTQWPTPEEYDQLAEESGLARSYIVSWFGDSRYSWKNGNLKWFFQYQSGNIEGPNSGGGSKLGSGSRKRRGRNRGWGRSRTRKQPRRSTSLSSDVDRPTPSKKFKTGKEILKEYYLKHHFLNEQDLDELVTKTNMSYEQVTELRMTTVSEIGIQKYVESKHIH
uniref:Zinc fingers and homeoboxes protein 1 n=1 Tax=Neolamprologus brichardi TaxID=32507 RepID=A0A3Q4GR28_NEOBR